MALLPTLPPAAIVSNIAAGIQGRVNAFLNFAVGSVFLAIAESVSAVALWLQNIALQVAMLTRLSTSYGPDVDSWLADWNIIARIGAVAATGLVTFIRLTASASTPVVPVGATVKTQDGTQAFQVYADPTNVAYSPTAAPNGQPGYVMPAQVTTLSVPVQSITNGTTGSPGSNGNVAAGAIALVSSQIPGIDQVTNPAAFTNGSDAELDTAVKARFPIAVAGLSKGTFSAIETAIYALQTGMQVTITENTDLNGAADYGMLTIVCDDGSGAMPAALTQSCQVAVQGVRAAGVSRVGVYAAAANVITATAQVSVARGYVAQTVIAQATAALGAYINGVGLGNPCQYFSAGAAVVAVPGVAKLEGLLLNGAAADIPGNFAQTIKVGTLVVSQI